MFRLSYYKHLTIQSHIQNSILFPTLPSIPRLLLIPCDLYHLHILATVPLARLSGYANRNALFAPFEAKANHRYINSHIRSSGVLSNVKSEKIICANNPFRFQHDGILARGKLLTHATFLRRLGFRFVSISNTRPDPVLYEQDVQIKIPAVEEFSVQKACMHFPALWSAFRKVFRLKGNTRGLSHLIQYNEKQWRRGKKGH